MIDERDNEKMSQATLSPTNPVVAAGFGIRTIAYLIDALILSCVGGAFPFLVITSSHNGPPMNVGQQVTTTTSGSILVSVVYFVIFWSRLGGGRTLGMRLLGLRVVQEDTMGQPSIVTAIVRWLGLWLSFAICFVGVIWVAVDRRHQGWHDKIARTLVIRA